jgi:hypothetical protein
VPDLNVMNLQSPKPGSRGDVGGTFADICTSRFLVYVFTLQGLRASHVLTRKEAMDPAKLTASSAWRAAGFTRLRPPPCASPRRLRSVGGDDKPPDFGGEARFFGAPEVRPL